MMVNEEVQLLKTLVLDLETELKSKGDDAIVIKNEKADVAMLHLKIVWS